MRKYNSATKKKQEYDKSVINEQRYPMPKLDEIQFTFFQSAVTAFIEDLRRNIRRFTPEFPVYIFNTGEQLMTADWTDSSTEDTYQQVPRMVCDVDAITIAPEQITSPYERGEFILTIDDRDVGYSAYLRRIPVTLPIHIKITLSNIIEQLKWQEVILLLLYKNNTFHFQHYKKDNRASYRLPDDNTVERNVELGFDDARRNRTISFTVNIDLQYPAFDYFNSSSLFSAANIIKDVPYSVFPDPTISDSSDKNNTPDDNSVTTDLSGNGTSNNDNNFNYSVNASDVPGNQNNIPKTGDQFPDIDGKIKYDEQVIADELGFTSIPHDASIKVPQTLNSQDHLPEGTLYKK